MRGWSGRVRAAVVGSATALLLAACSGGDASGSAGSAAAPAPPSGPAASTSPLPPSPPADPSPSPPPASAPSRPAGPTWYLALGDSLAAGYQPGQGEDPATAYPARLLTRLRNSEPGLRLRNLACSGETAVTLVEGGRCSYRQGSQLDAAVAFLRQHRDDVRLVTIDIGANDVVGCVTAGADRAACVDRRLPTVRDELGTALRRLSAAAPGVRIVGMTYYQPFLATEVFAGAGGLGAVLGDLLGGADDLARGGTVQLARLNTVLRETYARAGADVADVAAAFRTGDTAPVESPLGTLPRDVAEVCRLTWMCDRADFHLNAAGAQLVADTFAEALSS